MVRNHASPVTRVVERNIRALLERREREEQSRSAEKRIADAITRFTGSMGFVYLHLLVFGVWIVVNLGWTPRLQFDPTFVVLAMFASVEAIFLSTFVLITQNKMARDADRRAELDLQVSLLAEHEVTRLIHLVSAVGEKLGIALDADQELGELKQDIHPEQVLDTIDRTEKSKD
jgi:uncharacterized membrane protein